MSPRNAQRTGTPRACASATASAFGSRATTSHPRAISASVMYPVDAPTSSTRSPLDTRPSTFQCDSSLSSCRSVYLTSAFVAAETGSSDNTGLRTSEMQVRHAIRTHAFLDAQRRCGEHRGVKGHGRRRRGMELDQVLPLGQICIE